MPYTELAQRLQAALGLGHPPVALTFATAAPAGIAHTAGAVPSACTFWRRGERDVFYAAADDHQNCLVGAMTMGFAMSDEQRRNLMDLVGTMGAAGYVDPAEAANIPSVPGEKSGIVYGPLEHFPLEPDVVLLWVNPNQSMLLDEAMGGTTWTPERSGLAAFGRPSCAAIPVALARGQPVFSVGCMGMRMYTDIEADLQLAVLPKSALAGLPEALTRTVRANELMSTYYSAQKARFTDAPALAGTAAHVDRGEIHA